MKSGLQSQLTECEPHVSTTPHVLGNTDAEQLRHCKPGEDKTRGINTLYQIAYLVVNGIVYQ